IPAEVQSFYRVWRATPLCRARNLEKALDTPAKIYFKYEGDSPTGSHKLNTALPQAYYNKEQGIKRIATETGAGQWACALAVACSKFDLECMAYMVKVSYEGKPYRRIFVQSYGGQIVASPSTLTNTGRVILANDPDCSGSLGIAISEAVEDTVQREDTRYCLGSVLNHVLLHQSVIGLESKKQMEKVEDFPDIVIGCVGGGSNFGGIALPYMPDKLAGKDIRLIGVEPTACPTLTRGIYAYDFGDTGKMTPMMKMYTLGHSFIPSGIHAGGLRYHGASGLISKLYHDGYLEARAYGQLECFDAALSFARTEMILPAPESSHAVKAAIDEALLAKEEGKEKTILFCLSGHGFFDMSAYENYLSGNLHDVPFSEEALQKSLAELPQVPQEYRDLG
ncbi:MAG: TrpB-like pyridoxal phosphate-dependent enzyme, partial [Clostridiales bacterium]|nr:TrpB-like pyridoxal phosphate-dependent enzyme [Clostridiales bacterium]